MSVSKWIARAVRHKLLSQQLSRSTAHNGTVESALETNRKPYQQVKALRRKTETFYNREKGKARAESIGFNNRNIVGDVLVFVSELLNKNNWLG